MSINFKQAITEIPQLQIQGLASIEELLFLKTANAANTLTVSFLFKSSDAITGNNKFIRVKATFIEIANLKLTSINSSLDVAGFEIINIEEKGWENMLYEIVDNEDDAISFFCKDIYIDEVSIMNDNETILSIYP